MKKIVGVLLVCFAMLFACGPSTPGTGMLCGPAPDPTVCPNATCVCFLVQCGWSCGSGSNDQITPDNGWSVSDGGVWVQSDAGVGSQ